MSDAATNVRVPFVPQNSHGDSSAAVLPSTDTAVPVVRSTVPTAGPVSEPVSGEWEEPALPDVDEVDVPGVVPAVAPTPVVSVADDRPTAEHPAVTEDASPRAPKHDAPKLDAPEHDAAQNGATQNGATQNGVTQNGATQNVSPADESRPTEESTPEVSTPEVPAEPAPAAEAPVTGVDRSEAPAAPSAPQHAASAPVPAPAVPQQWQGGQNGVAPAAQAPVHTGQAPFQQHAAQFQTAQAPGQAQRPAAPQLFGPSSQNAPAAVAQQASMRPMGESLSAPMSTASSSFNQQIRFSDAAVRVTGWRAWLRRMGLDIGPSANDQEHAELVHRIRVPKQRFHVTSVFADNAGGTLLVGALGQILERTRADNVVALDLDPDGGDLDQVTAWHQGGSTARTLIQQSDLSDRNQVDKHLAVTSTNLHVLPTPWRFNGRDFADYDDVLDLYSIFRPHYSLALVDAGRGLQTPTGTGVLEISSALILPASATTRGVRKVAATIDWLRHHGWHGLLANTIVVINHTKRSSSVSVDQFDELFRAGQKLRVHEIPYDPHLDSDQPIDLDLLRKRTIRAFEELAADLADGFNSGYEPPAAQKLAELQQNRTTEGR